MDRNEIERRNDGDMLAIIMFVIFGVGAIVFWVWMSFIADCNHIDWLPVRELPGRCLPGNR